MTLATVHFKSRASGATLSGQFVLESDNAWQVAVDGKVRVLQKDEWQSTAAPFLGSGDPFAGLFGGAR